MLYIFIFVWLVCLSVLIVFLVNLFYEVKIVCKLFFFGYFFSKVFICVCVLSGVLLLVVLNFVIFFIFGYCL